MEANGTVRGGADLSDQSSAVLTFRASSASRSAARDPVTLQVALRDGQVQIGGGLERPALAPGQGGGVLSPLLSEAGCSPVSDELEELWSATEGVLLGPKGTLMSGQTRVLVVHSTTFAR